MPQITKTRTTVYKIRRVAVDFSTFSEECERIRKNYRYPGFQCFNCSKKFKRNENISLAITDKRNLAICGVCARYFNEQLYREEVEQK